MKNTTSKSVQSGTQKLAKGNAMQSKPDAAQGLRDLFIDELKDIYWAEKALTKAIPKMIQNATTPELIEGLAMHLEVTKEHVTRLEDVFASIGEKAEAKKCAAMEGLIKEAGEIMESTAEGIVRDAGIISAAQKVEHYEIATYGTLRSFAKTLGEGEAEDLLELTLDEEKEADEKLSEIAEYFINAEAAGEGKEEEDEDEPNSSNENRKAKRR